MDITELKRNNTKKRHPWEETRAKIIRNFIRKYHPQCFHLLDIGSGDAFVLNFLCLNKVANKYTAVDTAYTKEIVDSISGKNRCHIQYLQQLPDILNSKADCVLLLDVLEHCEDDNAVLQLSFKNIIQPAVYIITVPAFQNIFSEHDKLLQHYRRYTTDTLSKLCDQNNLEIVSVGYFFFSLLIIRRIQLALEKLGFRKPKKSVDNWKGSSIISKLIITLLWVDFIIGRLFLKFGIKIPGLSAYCICRLSP